MITKKKAGWITNFGRTIHPKKWDYSSVKRLFKKFKENGSMDRRHGSGHPRTVSMEENLELIKEFACSQEEWPHTYLPPSKITEQTGISQSLIQRIKKGEKNLKKETLNRSSAWKHYKWVEGLNRRETQAGYLRERFKRNIRVIKKRFGKMKKISLLKFLSICRTIMYMVKERNLIFLMKI